MRFSLLPLFVIAAVSMIAFSCIEEPATPTWETNSTLPFLNTTYTVERFVEEARDGNVIISQNGTIDYIISKKYDRVIDIQDSLTLSLSRSLQITGTGTVGSAISRSDSLRIVGGKVERIDTVFLKKGRQRLTVTNQNNSSGSVTLTFSTIINRQNNQPLSLTTVFTPNSTNSIASGSLENYRITSPNRTDVPFTVSATLTNGSQFNLNVVAVSDSFVANYVRGVIWDVTANKPANFDIDVEPLDISAFNSIDTVAGDAEPELQLNIFNFFNIEDTIKPIFRSINTRRSDTLLILEQNRNIVRFVPASPLGVAPILPNPTVLLNKTNSNMVPFVLKLPNKVITDGVVVANPRRLTGSAFDTSTIALDFELKIPLRFTLDTLSSSDSTEIDEEINTSNFENVALVIRAESSIPFNTESSILFLDAQKRPLKLSNGNNFTFPRQGQAERLLINSAPIGSDGASTGFASSDIRLNFNTEELRLLKEAKFAFSQVFLNTKVPTARRSVIRSTDVIRLRGTIDVRYRVGG